MYTTKSISELKANREAAMQPPPEDLCMGYVVVKEEDPDEEPSTCCWGLYICCPPMVEYLPFPQNKTLRVEFTLGRNTYTAAVLFVPVINLPLYADRYYVVAAAGKHKGLVYTCSTEVDDLTPSCFSHRIRDVKPKPFDHRDIYQQMEIIPKGNFTFTAKSVAPDGFPPLMFRQYWKLYENEPENYQLGEARGVNQPARLNYQELDVSISVITGKWYCPFFFIKERTDPEYQMQRSMFYEVTLEQFWEEVHRGIEKKRILLKGEETMREEMESNDGFVWFRKTGVLNGEKIGLSLPLWERIKWEENRGGWDDQGTGAILEEQRLGDSVLVERFSFKRLNGTVVLALDFLHTDKVRIK